VKLRIAKTLEDAIAREDEPLSQLVLEYSKRMRDYVDACKVGPEEEAAKLAILEELVDTERFERVGTYLERVNWAQYRTLIHNWGMDSNWDCHVRRVSQQAGFVVLELTEFGEKAATKVMEEVCSASFYEFDENRKLVHLDVYLQAGKKDAVPEKWGEPA
jgi:hypothetical protein